MQKFDVILTSCNRHDLLKITVESFYDNLLTCERKNVNNFYIFEDSEKIPIIHGVTIIGKGRQIGQIRALDELMKQVETPYYFSLEDDWEFIKGGFISESFEVLEKHHKCVMYNIRGVNDQNGHPIQTTTEGNKLIPGYKKKWFGFGFNPSLRRLGDYKKIGRYSNIATFNIKRPWESEVKISKKYYQLGCFTLCSDVQFVKHIGENRGIRI